MSDGSRPTGVPRDGLEHADALLARLSQGEPDIALDDIQCLVKQLRAHMDSEEQLRLRAEEASREWEITFDSVGAAVWVLDREQRILRANRVPLSAVAPSCSDVIGKSCWEVMHAATGPIAGCAIQRARRSLRRETTEVQIGPRWFGVAVDPILDLDGQFAGAVHIMNDITDRKRTDTALRESRELLRVVLDTIPLRVFWKDTDHKYLGCNLPYLKDSNLRSLDELLGKTDVEMGWTEHAAEHRAKERQVMESGLPQLGHEMCLGSPGGQVVWLLTNRTPLRDETGAVTGVLCTYEDISERKRTEATLRESEERFRLAFVTSPDSININRLRDGAYIAINQGFMDITGYTHADVTGNSSLGLSIWVDPADRSRLVEVLREDGSCANLEAQFRTRDGRIITGLMSASVIILAGEECILSITRDITDRKEMETSLQERLAELNRFNKAMINREVRMVELKKEINGLLAATGKPEKYRIAK